MGSVNSNAVLKLMGRGGVRGAGPPRGPGRGGLRGIMTFADISNLNPLSPNSDTSNFSLQYYYLIKHTGHENRGNDHQLTNVSMFNQILPTSNIRNRRSIVRRI